MAREPVLRTIDLVRHGQYVPVAGVRGGVLTPLGRAQARTTARRLAQQRIHAVICSDLGRATETAEIIAAALGRTRLERLAVLRECIPTGVPGSTVPLRVRRHARECLDAIVERFFCPLPRSRHELLVCHGNLIRALVCRALGARISAWRKMDTHNGGITRLVIRKNGSIRVVSFNDTGHLRGRLLTQS